MKNNEDLPQRTGTMATLATVIGLALLSSTPTTLSVLANGMWHT